MDGRGWMGKELLVPAIAEMPFNALLDKDAPELLECFHTCLLPPGSQGRPPSALQFHPEMKIGTQHHDTPLRMVSLRGDPTTIPCEVLVQPTCVNS